MNKYEVIGIDEEEIQSQEIYINYIDTENGENERYVGIGRFEANEFVEKHPESFQFENPPSIADVEKVLMNELTDYGEGLNSFTAMNFDIYDTTTGDCPGNWKTVSKEYLEYLSYEGVFEVFVGSVESIEIEKINKDN